MQPLGTFCEFKYGKSLPAKSRNGGAYPVYGSNGIVGYHDAPLTNGAAIIVGRKGSAGALQYSPISCCPIDTTYYVDQTCTEADLRWLFFTLQNLGLEDLNKHVAVPGLNRNDAYAKELIVPPLDEQKRIAAVLDKADDLRRQRQEFLQLNEKLLQSVFIDMFVRNPDATNWTSRSVEWTAKDAKGSIRTGPFGSQLLHSEFVDHGIAVLGIDNAVKNRFVWGQPRFITPKKYQDLKRYKVLPGDLIITIMGTLGRCAIVPDDIPEAINTKHLCCITLDQNRCLPAFLHAAFLNHPEVLRQLGVRAKGAVMPGLNMGIIKDLKLPIPPIELQMEFKRVVTTCTTLSADLEDSQDAFENLFGSIQQRAFRGELDLRRLNLVEHVPPPASLTTQFRTPDGRIYHRPGSFIAPPEIELDLRVLEEKFDQAPAESRPWSENYFKYRTLSQALLPPFSFAQILEATLLDMEKANYDDVKDRIFEYVAAGILEQQFDEARKEIVFYPRP